MLRIGLSLVFVSVAGALFAQVDPQRVVATVNGVEIKGQEYYRRMEFLPGIGKRMGNSMVESPPGFFTLEQLITERLVLQLAREKGVSPSEPEIEAEYRADMMDDPKMLENWQASGKTKEELVYQIKVGLAEFKLKTAGITITDQEIAEYYKNNPSMFTAPKRYKLRVIVLTAEEDKKKVDDALAAGKPFSEVATQFSQDITKVTGGDFGLVPIQQIPEGPIRDAITTTKIGQTTSWLQQQTVWSKYLLEDIKPEELEPMSDALRRAVRRQMMLDAGGRKNDVPKEMAELRKRSKITIGEKAFSDAYQKFVDTYLKDQSTKTGG